MVKIQISFIMVKEAGAYFLFIIHIGIKREKEVLKN